MPAAEFEEKTFEQPLNQQLLARSVYLFAPGQVLEKHIGIDAALLSGYPYFWNLWRRKPAAGLPLAKAVAKKYRSQVPMRKSFVANVFIQHKRPYRLTTTRSKEWTAWNRAYYRFDLLGHQQRALAEMATRAGQSAIVCYASPAFWTFNELCDHIEKNTIVQNTHFCRASSLVGHRRYSYADPGTNGKAHSEPVEIERLDLLGEISRVVAHYGERTPHDSIFMDDNDNIFRLAGRLVEDVAASEEHSDLVSFWSNYHAIVAVMLERLSKHALGDSTTVDGFVKTGVFAWLLGTEWAIVGLQVGQEGDDDDNGLE